MTKNDLQVGMIVMLADRRKYIVMSNPHGSLFLARQYGSISLAAYNNDMTHNERNLWVVAVYQAPRTMCVSDMLALNFKTGILWERENTIDWTTIPVDTEVLVKAHPTHEWQKSHFAKCENGKVYVFPNGSTSWTAPTDDTRFVYWKYATLPR